jgi:NTP pyrophosphatase (non-canonical NTP hydrolase)
MSGPVDWRGALHKLVQAASMEKWSGDGFRAWEEARVLLLRSPSDATAGPSRTDHLLFILAEECAEVAQRAAKAFRFGLLEVQPDQGEFNAARLEEELRDLLELARMLEEEGTISPRWQMPKPEKRAKVELFLGYSRELGRLA